MRPLWIDSRPASPAGSRLSIRISAVERYPHNFDSSYPPGVDIWISGLCHARESGNPVRASDARMRGHDRGKLFKALRRYLRDSYPQPVDMWMTLSFPRKRESEAGGS